ncbi:hypothetical protein MSIMFB_03837 [Mycobacterium simulans]|uniref:Uncharacterized protein n=1 Tax=Mycobacterium simulans TaxID=627089 RepID=A0A7Z7IMK3_9MYCO|nr:hypothetical protein [Mycobacterium simulans]SOJ56360.1 hypothetical protein MSIMFB_03837 [Mycobacterium simulans]
MSLVDRATKSASSVAGETVSTVSQLATALAEGVVVTTRDIRTGVREGRIRPRTVFTTAAIGLVAVAEWPVLVAGGGVALVASKLKSRSSEAPQEEHSD